MPGLLLTAAIAAAAAVSAAMPTAAVSPAMPASFDASPFPTSFSFVSAPGDVIGRGQSRQWTALNTKYLVRGTAADLTFNVRTNEESWDVRLVAPAGEKLTTRVYRDAELAGAQRGRAPGLSVSGAGRNCTDVWGSFAVHQIETFSDGGIRTLEATFEQRCNSADAPMLTGTVRFHVRPLSYAYTSDPGDQLGRGTAKTYLNGTSTFSLDGTAGGISYRAEGLRDSWRISLAPPTGEQLAERTYPDAKRLPDATHPGLDVSVNGRSCHEVAGDFTITRLVADATGRPVSFAVTFTAHCEAGKPALRGDIHYFR